MNSTDQIKRSVSAERAGGNTRSKRRTKRPSGRTRRLVAYMAVIVLTAIVGLAGLYCYVVSVLDSALSFFKP